MVNFRIIARVFSLVIIAEGLFMVLSAAVSVLFKEPLTILFSGIITVVAGLMVFTPLRNDEKLYGNKEGFIIITGLWLIMGLFGTLPYIMTGTIKSFGDAFFESISGFTTTGATIIQNVESLPHGILFWRSITQWFGGISFIIISLSVLQVVKSINIQLTITDFTGQASDKINPRVMETIKRLVTIYVLLTLAEAFLLVIGGMSVFDALCQSFATMSTGGFSTRNNSITWVSSPYILAVFTLFMFIAGTNMTVIYFGLKRNFRKVTGNHEFRFYLITCIVFSLVVSLTLLMNSGYTAGKAFSEGVFQVVSTVTTTGFYHANYNIWGNFLILILFIMMFIGGMSGSASGSIKIMRLLLTIKNARHEMRRMIHPNAFIPVRLDKKIVPQGIINNLLVFITLYFLVLCFAALITSFMGNDIVTSFSTSAAMLGNIGPGLGSFGPLNSYASLPMAGKWFYSFLMMAGRIELFSVFVLFTSGFYRR